MKFIQPSDTGNNGEWNFELDSRWSCVTHTLSPDLMADTKLNWTLGVLIILEYDTNTCWQGSGREIKLAGANGRS